MAADQQRVQHAGDPRRGRTRTRPPARPSCRSTPPAPTPRPHPATTRGTSTAAAGTRPARHSKNRPRVARRWRTRAGVRVRAWPPPQPCFGALLRPGDEVAASADLYGGTFRLLERVFKPWGLTARYTPTTRSAAGFEAIITPKNETRVDRDADEPAAPNPRHRGDRRSRPQARGEAGGR